MTSVSHGFIKNKDKGIVFFIDEAINCFMQYETVLNTRKRLDFFRIYM